MDPGTILAVINTSSIVLSLIAKYYSGVKKAREDIEGLKTGVETFCNVLRKIQELVRSSNAAKLPLSASLATAIKGSSSEVENIKSKLDSSKGKKAMSRVGLRALQWPFTKIEVQEHLARLEGHKTTLTLALSSAQTSLILGIDGNVSQLQRDQNAAQQDQNLAEQDRQLGKLLFADGAAFDSFYRQHEPQCVQNTRIDLLRQIQTWNTDSQKCIFWLNGMAGTGKSTIARTVACAFADQRLLGASFFFSRGVGDLGHATKFISTLARQLASLSLSPFFKQHISQAIADNENVTRQGLRNQWKELIFKPLSMPNMPQLTLTLVIDALDECERDEDIKLILQLFVEVKDLVNVKLKIFLTSRPDTPIRLGFKNVPEILHQSLILHDIPRSIVQHDIGVFLRHELDKIRKDRNLPSDWPANRNIDLLVKRSDCLFIYIATACRFIQDPNWPPQDRLSLILGDDATGLQPTAELDGIYMQVLKLSVMRLSGEKDKSRLSNRFRHIIGSLVTLFDVLSTVALAGLLNVSVEAIKLTLDSLHSLINVPKQENLPLRLLHPSFRDFLVNNERCDNSHFYINQELLHIELARSCLKLLFRALKRDICNLRMPGTMIQEVPLSKIDDHLSKDIQYACQYWVDHLERVDNESRIKIGLHNDGQIHEFLLKHFLHWLEALSLMGKISEGLRMIVRLESMLKFDEHSALKALVSDAKRFIIGNRSIMEEAPLQIYGSALVFCPKESVIKASYSNELPTWITRYPIAEDSWSSSLQVLEGHTGYISAVAFSSDSQLLASASQSGKIRIWDLAIGTLRSTLEDHNDGVNAVAFSGKGQLLASVSTDQTVRLWDAATGTLQGTLEGHTRSINAVAFSGDDQLLVSASADQTVRLWDPTTGKLQRTLEGHIGPVNAVAFSGDGQLLASGSWDRTIRLWDPATGMLQSTLEGHTDMVNAVTFSGDGQLLASASGDTTVRLWDSMTRMLRNMLEGHTASVTAVAFSSDGQLLASASEDQTVRLWDSTSGTQRSMLEGHTGSVGAVAFSCDGQLLASADDSTVRLWDPTTSMQRSTLEGHISAVAFSDDGQFLASLSADRTVRVWDPTTGMLRSTLEGHTGSANANTYHAMTYSGKRQVLEFSGNGQLLASLSANRTVPVRDPTTGTLQNTLEGHTSPTDVVPLSCDGDLLPSWDRTIRLLDSTTGMLQSTLEGHTASVNAVAFSGDGQLLASASADETVRVWDPTTGMLQSTLEGHKAAVNAVAFSGDDQLASVSSDRTVRVWDPTTGTLQNTLVGHTDVVNAVAFSGDGQLLASASVDRTVRVWDPTTGTLQSTLKGHTNSVNTVVFSKNGQLLASASSDRTIRLWDPSIGNQVQLFEAEDVEKLSFSPDQAQLETNLGLIQLSNDVNHQCDQSLQLGSWMVQRNWLTWNDHKALWLPPYFRPSCSGIRDNLIVMGHMSGRVTFLGLRPSFDP